MGGSDVQKKEGVGAPEALRPRFHWLNLGDHPALPFLGTVVQPMRPVGSDEKRFLSQGQFGKSRGASSGLAARGGVSDRE